MKIAIQTLRLHINYGGILQAYALQTVLQRMGHEVYVISCPLNIRKPSFIKIPLVWLHRFVRKYIIGDKKTIIFLEQVKRREMPILSQHTQSFINSYIKKLSCLEYIKLPVNFIDAIVVGSDQIWRPGYAIKDIKDEYLAYTYNWNIKRIAYAASFGTDKWEYTDKQTAECKKLLSRFDAVSVREDSAVKLCKEYYAIDAKHVLDPTMLLNKEDYIELVEKANTPKSSGNLLVYILDETPDKQAIVDAIAQNKGLTPFNTKASTNSNATLAERIQPPLEQWLRGFMDAEFVVTDSFHACVFAIIFNKPFIAYGNASRGASRFHSLLKMFELERLFISSSGELNIESLSNINWQIVNKKHSDLKNFSFDFIKKHINDIQ